MKIVPTTLAALACLAGCAGDGADGGAAEQAAAACEGRLGCLRLEEVMLVGDADGPGMIAGESGTARRDGRGQYYVYQEFGQDIKLFSPAGQYLTTIGRAGAGPGEFRGISVVHPGPADSLHVIDLMNVRWSVFSPDHELVRSTRLTIPVYMQLKLLPDGRGLFSAPVRGELGTYPLHLLDAEGAHIRSFGEAPEEFGPPSNDGASRRMASAGPTSVWAGYRDRYRLELWDAEGLETQPRRVLERSVDWFPPGVAEVTDADGPPAPRLQAVRQDSAGRLLVLMHVADARWQEGAEPGAYELTITDRHRYRDTRIEMLDAETGELLASARSDLMFHALVADDLAIASVTDEMGAPRVAVWSVTLDGDP